MRKIQADEVVIGQKISHREPYSRSATEGIVIDIEEHYCDPVNRITFTLWSWEGYDELGVWEVEDVTVLWEGTHA